MENKNKLITGIVIFALIGIGALYFAFKSSNINNTNIDATQNPVQTTTTTNSNTVKNTTSNSVNVNVSTGVKTYSMSEVATHNSQTSCYTTINGKVYNLTSWISQHPGGAAAILSLCGKDGTAQFMAQHGGQGRPETELASLFISNLK